ncbi:hypothetical protein CHRYSEOSP005_15030 [Chryseobacterium sp. Alg-005]|uniref:DUF6527 family protein n=1 Tax=Chryseobacterium sp. Alg-005 TaxID=3159516 RepID=UPI0035557865
MKFVEPINQDNELMTGYYMFDCPGCKCSHYVNTNDKWGNVVWDFNGNLDKPTVRPSILVHPNHKNGRCHSFITDGKIQYLIDCDHELAGETVELP